MSEARAPRVLVVDDDEHVRAVLCDALVLTDFRMPGGDGLDLIAGVRHADPSIGVIMLTASSIDLDAQSRQLEFTVLRKPLHFDELKLAVGQALARRSPGSPVA